MGLSPKDVLDEQTITKLRVWRRRSYNHYSAASAIRLVQRHRFFSNTTGNPMQTHTGRTLKSAEIRSRIEPELKEKSVEVLASLGLDLSDAIRLFLRKVVDEKGLPFSLKQPNATTVAAMTEARESSRKRFEKPENLFDALERAPKKEARKSS